MVTNGLALIFSHNIKPFTNHLLWYYECAESVSRTEIF